MKKSGGGKHNWGAEGTETAVEVAEPAEVYSLLSVLAHDDLLFAFRFDHSVRLAVPRFRD